MAQREKTLIRAGAFIGYALFNPFWILMVMALLNGLGGGLNAPSTKATIAALALDTENKTTVFPFVELRRISVPVSQGFWLILYWAGPQR